MATATLIPSSYYVSSSYLSVSDVDNMYANVSSTTFGTVTNTNASTNYFYFYLRGFNISDIPAGATVSSFTVKLKGRATGAYNSSMYLCNGTSTISKATATQIPNSLSATTRTFTNGDLIWDDIVHYGSDFGIRINCRRNAKSTQSYYYIYGAEIDVTYTVPVVSDKVYGKIGGSWVEATKTYKKTNGVWVEQTDVSNIFDPSVHYKMI